MKIESFDQIEQASERKYVAQQEQEFQIIARRDKLFGQWAAGQLGYSGAAAQTYVRAVIDSNFEKPGDDDILGKVRADFQAAHLDDRHLESQLSACRVAATLEIGSEAKE